MKIFNESFFKYLALAAFSLSMIALVMGMMPVMHITDYTNADGEVVPWRQMHEEMQERHKMWLGLFLVLLITSGLSVYQIFRLKIAKSRPLPKDPKQA